MKCKCDNQCGNACIGIEINDILIKQKFEKIIDAAIASIIVSLGKKFILREGAIDKMKEILPAIVVDSIDKGVEDYLVIYDQH